jgi:Protein of unknown function (DUF2934)
MKRATDDTPAVSEERVAARAFEIYLDRGQQGGRELEDWLQAEAELLTPPSNAAQSPKIGRRTRE